ncbi:DUF4878 domain-containing protein [Mycobacterium sp. TNTM28]|uniref:DUF4878 domain-containing protein n=1 Tax=[Mycobacterium] fortunisiensis TaxID=2600579 RepID=A0ABS6KH72_9MYCO|nr:DUF4878 domain-containing protein [[Mycobacterium] fortunisiensis]MBU9762913.1 DUF4878 domain-containing protein [[Mycobacterium] fortunisiensis]
MTQPPHSQFGGPNPVDGTAPQTSGYRQAPPPPPPQQWDAPAHPAPHQTAPHGYGAPAAGGPPAPPPPPQGGWQGPLQPGFSPQPPRRNKKALLITAGATAAVLLVVGIVVGIVSFSGGGPGGIGGRGASSASEAVKGYLDALSKGDANAALAFGSDQPASKDFLTDEILKQQIEKWPITNVRILSANETGDMAQVHVVANFGDQSSDQTLMVKKQDGGWKLTSAAAKLNLAAATLTSNPVTGQPLPAPPISLFGKPISNGSAVYVFPGWVDLGSSNKYISVAALRPVLLDGLVSQSVTVPAGLQLQLTEEGSAAAKKVVADAVAECAKSTALAPPNCPQRMLNPALADGTAHWEAPDLAAANLQYRFMSYDLSVHVLGTSQWKLTANGTDGVPMQGNPVVGIMGSIDMTQDPLTVKWAGQ